MQLPEIEEIRSTNSKSYLVGLDEEGKEIRKMIVFQQPIHYSNPKTGKLEQIDTRFIPQKDGWKMDKAPYSAFLKDTFGADFLSVGLGKLKLDFSLHQIDMPTAPIK